MIKLNKNLILKNKILKKSKYKKKKQTKKLNTKKLRYDILSLIKTIRHIDEVEAYMPIPVPPF
jgi:hypothetical protein